MTINDVRQNLIGGGFSESEADRLIEGAGTQNDLLRLIGKKSATFQNEVRKKTISLGDFLTDEEIIKCIGRRKPYIKLMIIQPNLERINKTLGQENDADYLAYLAEFICNPQQTDSI